MKFSKQDILRAFLSATRINLKGKSIKEKVIIIESDDWGAIRTPSKNVLENFKAQSRGVEKSIYKVDALESETDLAMLFQVLSGYKGSDGLPAKITANTIMANPDFERIKASGFQQYYYEKFTATYQKYPEHDKNIDLWEQAISANIIQPQYHGREHLQYKRWLNALNKNDEEALFWFDQKSTYSGNGDYSFMEAYDWDVPDDISEQIEVIEDGLNIFEDTFGFFPKSFIAPCYNWDTKIETILHKKGIEWIQGGRSQLAPTGKFNQYHLIRHYFGESNTLGMNYNVRNCIFEPSMLPNKNWVDSCLAQIQSAFLLNKPAVICSHRINFIGFIDEKNRERGLRDLDELLKAIVKKWPDVLFKSTDELSQLQLN